MYVHFKMEIYVEKMVTINKYELYKIKEYKICMVNIDLWIHNKQSKMGY